MESSEEEDRQIEDAFKLRPGQELILFYFKPTIFCCFGSDFFARLPSGLTQGEDAADIFLILPMS
jgi:hypothetical protein